jgi:phage shock protein E
MPGPSSMTKAGIALSLVVLLFASACGGMPEAPERPRSGAPSRLLSPAQFETAISRPNTEVINVHVPYEGEIPGTDSFIPYDQIVRRRGVLPPRSVRLAIYCRSGPMSATAARTLSKLGYRDISELGGGMRTWEASGRALRHRRG